eukprot:tig00000889_g5329.t1
MAFVASTPVVARKAFAGKQIASASCPATAPVSTVVKAEAAQPKNTRREFFSAAAAVTTFLALPSASFAAFGEGAQIRVFEQYVGGKESQGEPLAERDAAAAVERINATRKKVERAVKKAEKGFWADLRGDLRLFTASLGNDVKIVAAAQPENAERLDSLKKEVYAAFVDADNVAKAEASPFEAAGHVSKALKALDALIDAIRA